MTGPLNNKVSSVSLLAVFMALMMQVAQFSTLAHTANDHLSALISNVDTVHGFVSTLGDIVSPERRSLPWGLYGDSYYIFFAILYVASHRCSSNMALDEHNLQGAFPVTILSGLESSTTYRGPVLYWLQYIPLLMRDISHFIFINTVYQCMSSAIAASVLPFYANLYGMCLVLCLAPSIPVWFTESSPVVWVSWVDNQ